MRLNVDILVQHLEKKYRLHAYGSRRRELELRRPEFYMEGTVFCQNHCYLAMADRLPPNPAAKEGSVVIVLGGKPPAVYLAGETMCVIVLETLNQNEVFNYLQEVNNRFDEWEMGLFRILGQNGSVQDMLDVSFPILENPVMVTDFDYHFIAFSDEIMKMDELKFYRADISVGGYSPEKLATVINGDDKNRSLKEPFLDLDEEKGIPYFCENLFAKGSYVGNMKVSFLLRQYHEGDFMVCHYLAKLIEQAFTRNVSLQKTYIEPVQSLLRELLDGHSIEESKKLPLLTEMSSNTYICAKIAVSKNTSAKIPVIYILDYLKKIFPGCIAFEYGQRIAAFIPFMDPDGPEAVRQRLMEMMENMHLSGGISCPFHDLTKARIFWRQAGIAVTMGEGSRSEEICHDFQKYKLTYMCECSTGEFSLSHLMSPGMKQLLEHDGTSQISYVETLRCYLDHNMNLTRTAAKMFVHRTTLIERIRRIEALLHMDLEDPEERLYLLLILKRLEMKDLERGRHTR